MLLRLHLHVTASGCARPSLATAFGEISVGKMKAWLAVIPLVFAAVSASSLEEIQRQLDIVRMDSKPKQQWSSSYNPRPLFHSILYEGGRTQVLVDQMNGDDDNVQTDAHANATLPFIGALGELSVTSDGGLEYLITCTASLIDRRTILTAAHCIDRNRQSGRVLLFIWGLPDVRVRSLAELSAKARNFATTDIERAFVHPDYGHGTATNGKPTLVNDIAVARLHAPLNAASMEPICLANGDITTDLVGIGWGKKNCYSDSEEPLRNTIGEVLNQTECNRNLRPQKLGVRPQHLCARFRLDNGKPAAIAKGDSGGPLFINTDPTNPIQIGIVSFGAMDFGPGGPVESSRYCLVKDNPEVYARVRSFKNFISAVAPQAKWC